MKKLVCLPLLLLLWLISLEAATVNGFVTQADNGEPLQYVNVQILETKVGMQTNKKGYFVINISNPGTYTLQASLVSHVTYINTFSIKEGDDHHSMDIQLLKAGIEMPTVVVTGAGINDPDDENYQIKVSLVRQTTQDIQNVVSVAEADVFRSVLTLPGVTPISDFSAGLYVRGGSPDQNLILLDDIDVYNPNHFGGVFSTFNSDAVSSVQLIKGGYPAQYGGRLSSVLDVTNRQGNRNYHQGVARLSAISSSATLEGPWKIGNQSGSYMGSYRRTYLELIKEIYDELPDYYFYDGHAKLNWDLDSRNKLSASTYFGMDKLSFDFGATLNLDWGNRTFTTQWVHLINSKLFAHFIVAGSEFRSNFSQESEDSGDTFERKNGINDLTAKGILSWNPNNKHQVDFGYEAKHNQTWLKMETNYQYDTNALPDVEVSSLLSSAYVQDVWDVNEFWTIQPGLRMSWYKTLEINLANSPSASYMNLEPRLSIRRKLDVGESVFFNYGRYYQYLTLMSPGMSSPFDMWFPLDGSLNPGQSDHYTLGYKNDLSEKFGFDMELYYKDYRNLLEFNVATGFDWDNANGQLADTFHVGKGFTMGADFMLRTDWLGWQGYLGYTIGKTRRKMEGTNLDAETGEGIYFYPKYDKTHQLNVVETLNITEVTGKQFLGADFKLGINFSYSTGQPNQKPERIFFDGEDFQLIYSYTDRERLPNYMRLDLSTKYEFVRSWGSIEPYIEAVNILNRKNVGSREYYISPDEEGNLKLQHEDGTQFPFLPFVGVNIKW